MNTTANFLKMAALLFAVLLLSFHSAEAQQSSKGKAKAAKPRPAIFALRSGGKYIEPIALIDKGALIDFAEESSDHAGLYKEFYRTGTKYSLIYGGAVSGTATVTDHDPNAECSGSIANVSVALKGADPGGDWMALASSESGSAKAKFFRRKPTSDEQTMIEALVRDEFKKNKVIPKELHSKSFTAIDRDHDGRPEFVGTYWTAPTKDSRALLFFIAEAAKDGKYSLVLTDLNEILAEDTMGGEIEPIDEGVGHEMFLDSFEFDGDDANEIFTYTPTYEGAEFRAYGKYEGKWERVFSRYHYYCAY